MTKRGIIRLTAILAALAMPLLTMMSVRAEAERSAFSTKTKYVSPDINELSSLGKEPEDISVTAGAEYLEKAWYEYVVYSEKAVASYRLDDNTRLLFYDPYTYTNSMVMEVEFDATTTEFDTMSEYSISKTNTKSITACVSSTDTSTRTVQTSGEDRTIAIVDTVGNTKTQYNHDVVEETTGSVLEYTDFQYSLWTTVNESGSTSESFTTTSTAGSETEFGIDGLGLMPEFKETIVISGSAETSNGSESGWEINNEWLTDLETHTTEYSPDYKTTTKYSGEEDISKRETSTTEGWTQLSARVTKSTGSSRSTSTSWSEEESVTVTKTYAATHFASDGVTPLPWAIVHYEVLMPMKCVMQVKHSGEWVNVSTVYTLLSTVKGTCRAWMQNGQVYYEDWGSGEPVVASDFWGQFMTREQLMAAYSNKLYPVGGVD